MDVCADSQRKYAAWIGGSMFASLSTFEHVVITKAEFEEGKTDVRALVARKSCKAVSTGGPWRSPKSPNSNRLRSGAYVSSAPWGQRGPESFQRPGTGQGFRALEL